MLFNQERPDASEVRHFGARELRKQLGGGLRPYSAVQLLFLLRLSNLLALRREHLQSLANDDWRLRLLNKATYSTYCDCVELGVGDDARLLFHQESAERRC